jgi:uncharacterized protein (DUF4415 family)
MNKVRSARAVLVDGVPYARKRDGTLVPLKGRTDWTRVDQTTEKDIAAQILRDPDGSPMSDADWARGELAQPTKVSVGLRLDDDVLRWFKSKGKGYQTRINTVLRRYMEAQRKAG